MPRTRTQQQQEQEARFVEVDSTVTFSGGVMFVNGAPQRPNQVQHWESSNGLTQYATVEWADPATGERRTSCNCPGWSIKKPGKPRSCTHTLDMEGVKSCPRQRVDSQSIRSVAQAVELIPEIQDGRFLRSIMID